MTRVEFETLINKNVTDRQYEAIELVYTYHPCISETRGKKQIAELYNTYGMRIITDMMPTATKSKNYEERIMKGRQELDELQQEFEEFKKGVA